MRHGFFVLILLSTTSAFADLCVPSEHSLDFPLKGSQGAEWVISNYIDADPASGRTKDYTGAIDKDAVTYDGHTGIDFAILNFNKMDEGVDVFAVSEGTVDEVKDGFPDRNLVRDEANKDKANLVRVREAGGARLVYVHFKKDSIVVKPGMHVTQGQKLGQVGSSGYSDGPHVHLGVQDCQGKYLDALAKNYFKQAPDYKPQARFRDWFCRADHPFETSSDGINVRGVSRTQFHANQEIYCVYYLSHVRRGDVISARHIKLSGEQGFTLEHHVDGDKNYFGNYRWRTTSHISKVGRWKIVVSVNGRELETKELEIIE